MYGTRPVIGICPLYDEKKDSYWMLPGYMNMLEAAGAVPMMLPLTVEPDVLDYFLETCDGFLLTGGQDVSPVFYGQEKTQLCGVTIPERDEWMPIFSMRRFFGTRRCWASAGGFS